VKIDGHVSGLGRNKHREFAHASGEMDEDAFTVFLTQSLKAAASQLKDGAIAYICMDWRHMRELLSAGHDAFDELKNLCVWNKTNGGMGTFYRSKHELVFVFKKGRAPHINNFGLGDTGRYRTNVWDYAGVNTFGDTRDDDLAMHPTVKPVAMIADAIRDCSKRGDIILDTFGGSGSILIAADQCGRKANLIELDPHYCDTIIRRYQRITGEAAVLERTGKTFAEMCAETFAEVVANVAATANAKTNLTINQPVAAPSGSAPNTSEDLVPENLTPATFNPSFAGDVK
jgi:DNA modification methylase